MAYSVEDVINDAQADGALSADEAATLRLGVERLLQIEAVITEYAAAHYAYETMPPRPNAPRYGDEVRAWNLSRAAMEQRIADARPPYKALLRELGEHDAHRSV